MERRLDRLLGRRVVALNGRKLGRVEEFRVRRQGETWSVVGYDVGPAGLLERLGLGARLLVGGKPSGYRIRWDQLAIADDGPLRLTCSVDELERF